MYRVLITGATGFVGSALAANLLARGLYVIAISRNDADGKRTIEKVKFAAEGFDLDIQGALKSHFEVVNVDFSQLNNSLSKDTLSSITEVWHVAAEMAYSTNRVCQSFEFNVGNTTRLYELINAYSPSCRRFYYVSTAYVAGMAGGRVEEELHSYSEVTNSYQLTKWSAEQALHLLYLRHGLPVTIFRPSVVTGHRYTAWTHHNGFGFYMFQEAMWAVAQAGHKEVTININGDGKPDLITIDRLTQDACSLTLRSNLNHNFEVFHCTGGCNLSALDILYLTGEISGVNVKQGEPVTLIDRKYERGISPNRPFAEGVWDFSRSKLDKEINSHPPEPLTIQEIRNLYSWYIKYM